MSKSKIEWTDETWNPVTGCTKVSAGCKHCYAERQWPRMTRLVPAYAGRQFSDVRCHPERLEQPLRWKRPRKVFVNSMSDLFHDDVPDWFIDTVFAVMSIAETHTFQVLTKRPLRMRQYLGDPHRVGKIIVAAMALNGDIDPRAICATWPLPNVWLGVSVEDQPSADERIPLLLQTPAAVRFISAEPLLGPVDLSKLRHGNDEDLPVFGTQWGLDWVIVGGESGPKARPMHPEWVRSLRDQCAAADVPFMFKQWGEWGPTWHEAHAHLGLDAPMDHAGIHSIAGTRMGQPPHESIWPVVKIGKKAAGRLLDDVLHDGYPR